jgi:glucose/arabinose dehydrogenase
MFSGLEGSETAAHFHGPAPQCENAGVQITVPLGSPKVGSATLTAQQMADLLAGLWYLNVHTDLHPGGEIRGQVMPAPLTIPIPEPISAGDIHIQLETVAAGLTAPNWGTFAPGGTDRLFVTDQDGILWAIDLDTGDKSVFLDVSARLVALGVFGPDSFDERGLLGVAFHPDYMVNGLLYTYTSEPVAGEADFSTMPDAEVANHQAVITEWQVPNPNDSDSVVDPNSARELLRVDEPQFNHNAGAVNFGPDGMLYIALGDGGGADDKDGQDFLGAPIIGHGCVGNGADNNTVLGSVLRIDPRGDNSANGQYGIPSDNPFVGIDGVDEIYAYGFRNPFRFSFDSLTGELYVGDVGQNDVEEIDLVVSGGNYGWNYKEGTFFFVANGNQPGYVTDVPLDVPPDLVDPIAQYDHDEGLAVVGGFVYRGSSIAPLVGRYVFGDFAQTFSNDGRLFYLDQSNQIREFPLVDQAELGLSLLGFGQDALGEVYVLGNGTGTPFGDTGVVLRIGLRPGDLTGDGCVDQSDLGTLLGDWGCTGGDCAGDLDGDGDTDQADLGILLSNWGDGCA